MKQVIIVLAFAVGARATAQSPIAVREIGRLERVSTVPLQAVSAALPLRDGRVLVNDARARRLIVLDSTLARETIVADTMGTTEDDYARGSGEAVFRFRGDSALLVNSSTQIALVIGPNGTRARVLAFPPPPGHPPGQQLLLVGGGSDARGRLIYLSGGINIGFSITSLPRGIMLDTSSLDGFLAGFAKRSDSLPIWRVDLATRHFDTVTTTRVPAYRTTFKTDDNKALLAIELTPDLLPMVDGWAILPDGTIAVVRGRDYHIDWYEADGHHASTPKMPFAWERIPEERKNALADSAVKSIQAQFDQYASGGGRGGRAGSQSSAPNVAKRPSNDALPEYVPPFERGDVRADAEGNVWIRTSTVVKDRPVYDIVNRKGEIVDRVQLPAFRVISGFGPGVVFMAVTDSSNVVRLERARIR